MFDLLAQKLAASVISAILDTLRFRDQVMRTTIRPVFAETGNEALKKIATEHLTEEELKTGTLATRGVCEAWGAVNHGAVRLDRQ